MAAVSEKHAKEICKFGQGSETCAFLAMSQGYECTKGTNIEVIIRGRLAEGSMKAKGDNCAGIDVVNADPSSCKILCSNAGEVCSLCFGGDMANCKFDPNITDKTDCRSRCTKPEGVCEQGATLYEKLGYQFQK
jgi:hypothetical protein